MNIGEMIAHHVLDHDWGISLGGFRLPITNHSVTMVVVSILLVAGMYFVARTGANGKRSLLTTLAEEYVTFIRDGIVLPNIGETGRKMLPYFCTLFLFILSMNLVGMIPEAKTATSNVSVTAALALYTGFLIFHNGIKAHGLIGFLKGFVPEGTPVWLAPFIFVLEAISTIIKVGVLAVRLFANMFAGHLVLFCLLLIVFIIGKLYLVGGIGAVLPVMGMEVFVSCLELLVAFLQAYVFTLLTSIFVGSVVQGH